ncbi:hypothetical protein JYT19_01045 [Sulfobacillus acidophilus]|uniref:Uncharacterized protein n=1 Tax=Sulfobacillus acidophilus TaxID=53633 RepID=A0ABS3AXG0_9FIRM|nr:hypothetical protein [Sulfobacillus acidophilus]
MLCSMYEDSLIKSYFKIIKERANVKDPLHRAKAMLLALTNKTPKVKPLRKNEKEDFWANIKAGGWVLTNKMGYIIGLSQKAQEYLNK